jgi:polyhydroxyalkanoate synthase
MADEIRDAGSSSDEVLEQAAQHTLAANPLVGVRGRDILDSARALLGHMMSKPGIAAQQYLSFLGELGRIVTGASELAPDAKDKRFADPAWKESGAYRALAQCYLAWGRSLNRFVEEATMDKRDAERARFIASLFIDAMSPTNSLAGNPAAMKKLIETSGGSLVHGLQNFLGDLARNGGLPAQVDARKFAVGKNLATTPGSVIYRDAVMELIQYRPLGPEVHKRPLLIAPPQINKFYVFDLVPEKSIIRFALDGDLQTFAISWKNPTAAESQFGLDTYVGAMEQAVDVIRDVTRSADVNIWGSCSAASSPRPSSRTLLRAAKSRFTAPPWRCACSTWRWRKIRRPACSLRRNRSLPPRVPRASRALSKGRNWHACSPGCGRTT